LRKSKIFLISCLLAGIYLAAHAETVRVSVWEGKYQPNLTSFRGKYRGTLYVARASGRYFVINVVDVEDYLCGVIAREMEKNWPTEALKAQAVCSRSLVYYYMQKAREKNLPYDVSNSVFHQVYGGTEAERENVVEAVDSTAGEVLSYEGRIVPGFFHACCGGSTSNASDVWGSEFPYLVGVSDSYCSGTPFFTWRKVFSASDIGRVLGIKKVDSIRIVQNDSSGRVKTLEVKSGTGKKIVTGKDLRMSFINLYGSQSFNSEKVLPSTRFVTYGSGGSMVFEGTGYGHGVGLCQWGARKMAEEGFDYRQILKYYFPLLSPALVATDSGQTQQSAAATQNRRD